MKTIDRTKCNRIKLDLDERQAALRGLANLYADARDHVADLKQAIFSGADTRYLEGLWNGRDVAELAALPDADLDRARVDLPTLRAAVAQRERMTELRARHDAAAAEVAPLARLVARLTEYAEAHK